MFDETPTEEFELENFVFIPGILGQGAFGTVRLAKRKSSCCNNSNLSSCCGSVHSDIKTKTSSRCKKNKHDNSNTGCRCHDFRHAAIISPTDECKNRRQKNYVNLDTSFRSRDSDEDYAEMTKNDQLVAVKIFSKSNLERKRTIERDKVTKRVKIKTALQQVEREIVLMKKLSHPNLVQLYEVIDSPETDILYMILEYMPLGEILTYQEHNGTFKRSESLRHRKIDGLVNGHFDEEHAALYFVDILHGLAYLHQHHICHRDLKPANILLSNRGIAKVGDFGCATSSFSSSSSLSSFASLEEREQNQSVLTQEDFSDAYDMGRMAGSGMLSKTEGTWCFWSPEMCARSQDFSGYMADIWAAGICLYIFVTGELPFYNKVPFDLFEMIAKAEIQYSNLGLSDSLINLLKCYCLEKDPNCRSGVGGCLHHPFLQNAREQRIKELGAEFQNSRDVIDISEDDIMMAFKTVTSVPVEVLRSAGKKISEGLAHTRDNLRARIPSMPSLGSSVDSKDEDTNSLTFRSHLNRNLNNSETDSKLNDNNFNINSDNYSNSNKKSNHNIVLFSRQISGDSAHSDTFSGESNVHENGNSLVTDTRVSRLSSGISFGSTITEELPQKMEEDDIRNNHYQYDDNQHNSNLFGVDNTRIGQQNEHQLVGKQPERLRRMSTASISDEDSIKHETKKNEDPECLIQ
mmetsp:Transcript_19734/g.22051  ORF Transcript_19734/g.22051 Transcript_19734/m.22051 type:complete len:689 (+) Transcript_19734:190-2256(+)